MRIYTISIIDTDNPVCEHKRYDQVMKWISDNVKDWRLHEHRQDNDILTIDYLKDGEVKWTQYISGKIKTAKK